MKTALTVYPEAPSLARTRLADYVLLTKPRVAVLVLFTVAAGALLAAALGPALPYGLRHGSGRGRSQRTQSAPGA
jgi:heme O synthase-like polyprenyltransferase